jgi:hypothetical protein
VRTATPLNIANVSDSPEGGREGGRREGGTEGGRVEGGMGEEIVCAVQAQAGRKV